MSKQTKSKEYTSVEFFKRQPKTVFLLSTLTLNIYNLYWFYKQWRFIGKSTQKRTWPVLASLFQAFTVFALFRRIREQAEQLPGVNGWQRLNSLAIVYLLVFLFSESFSRYEIRQDVQDATTPTLLWVGFAVTVATTLIIAAITAHAQKLANGYTETIQTTIQTKDKKYVGEIIFVVIGIITFALNIFGYVSNLVIS